MLDVLQSNSFRVCAQCAVWWWWGSADSLLLTLFTCQKFVPAQLSPPLCKYHYSSFFCDTMYYLYLAKQRCKKSSLHYHQSPPSTLLLSVRVFDKYYDKELTINPPPPARAVRDTGYHTPHTWYARHISFVSASLGTLLIPRSRRQEGRCNDRPRPQHTLENDKKIICHQWGRNIVEMKWRDVFIVRMVWSGQVGSVLPEFHDSIWFIFGHLLFKWSKIFKGRHECDWMKCVEETSTRHSAHIIMTIHSNMNNDWLQIYRG